MNSITLKRISAQATYPIRHAVLRQGQPLSSCCFSDDELQSTQHFGLLVGDSLAGICSLYQRAPKHKVGEDYWQLRGMAVLPEYRGQGFGEKLLTYAIEQTITANAQATLWCNARLAAHSLYLRHGFCIIGEAFELPNIGPHYFMVKAPDKPY